MSERSTPLPPRDWPPAMSDALAALRPANPRHEPPPPRADRPKGLNLLGTMARHTDLTRAFHTFAGHVLFGTTLTPRQRELLVLRVAAVRDCSYEWAQHVVLAGEAGLGTDEIERVASGPDDAGWDEIDSAFVRAVDELLATARLADETWMVLAASLDVQQLMDLVFTVGAYDALAMCLQTFDIELDADLQGGNGLIAERD